MLSSLVALYWYGHSNGSESIQTWLCVETVSDVFVFVLLSCTRLGLRRRIVGGRGHFIVGM
jgi:hypothetical protein